MSARVARSADEWLSRCSLYALRSMLKGKNLPIKARAKSVIAPLMATYMGLFGPLEFNPFGRGERSLSRRRGRARGS
eukprot:766662-Hanusia_phi.AAC.3